MNISNTPYVNSTELPDGSLVFLADADARGGVRDLEETKASKESVEALKTAMRGIDPEDATPGRTASVLGWQEYDSVPEVESTETDMASHPLFRASLLDPVVKRDDLVYDDSSKWQAEPNSVIGRIAGLSAKTERLSAEAEHLDTETERLNAETERLNAETERLDEETKRLGNGQEDLASRLQTVAESVPVKLSEMRDEDGNPTTRTAVKLGADGSLKVKYRGEQGTDMERTLVDEDKLDDFVPKVGDSTIEGVVDIKGVLEVVDDINGYTVSLGVDADGRVIVETPYAREVVLPSEGPDGNFCVDTDFDLDDPVDYVAALFSTANKANNLDNIRTSVSDPTPAAATIDGKLASKRDKTDLNTYVSEDRVSSWKYIRGGTEKLVEVTLYEGGQTDYVRWRVASPYVDIKYYPASGLLTIGHRPPESAAIVTEEFNAGRDKDPKSFDPAVNDLGGPYTLSNGYIVEFVRAERGVVRPDGDSLARVSEVPDPVEVISPEEATTGGKAADALATKTALGGKRNYNDRSWGEEESGFKANGDSFVLTQVYNAVYLKNIPDADGSGDFTEYQLFFAEGDESSVWVYQVRHYINEGSETDLDLTSVSDGGSIEDTTITVTGDAGDKTFVKGVYHTDSFALSSEIPASVDVIKQSEVTDSTPYGKAADAKDLQTQLEGKLDKEYQGGSDHKGTIKFGDGSYPYVTFDNFSVEANDPSAHDSRAHGDFTARNGFSVNYFTCYRDSEIDNHGHAIMLPYKGGTVALTNDILSLCPPFDAEKDNGYAVGEFCSYLDGTTLKLYQCTVAHTGAWNAAHFDERDVSSLFTSGNTALVSVIDNIVGVPNALLEAALSGEEVA